MVPRKNQKSKGWLNHPFLFDKIIKQVKLKLAAKNFKKEVKNEIFKEIDYKNLELV